MSTTNIMNTLDETNMANAIRALAMDAVQLANSGHPGMPMGMADVATVLFNRFITLDPADASWPNRDRFVLSAGHGSMLVYALNHLLGYDDMGMDQLRNFRQLNSRTAGHPEYGHAKGIEVTTGPLGQGIATAVGMALAERMANARFPDLIGHWTWVIAGDGCLMEGISHEAIDMAGHLQLGNLVVLWDDNKITIDGSTGLSTSTDQMARFSASGWHVLSCDGHNNEDIAKAIKIAKADPRPSLIACHTTIGKGAPNKAGSAKAHGAPLGDDEIAATREALGWNYAPFDIPQEIYDSWAKVAQRGAEAHRIWKTRLNASSNRQSFERHMTHDLAPLNEAMAVYKTKLLAEHPKVATRKASEMALSVVNTALPFIVGGSADLTGSNLTKSAEQKPITKDDFSGSYMYYGIREHSMAAAMNGITLYGLFRPYGGTFMAFADYSRPAIRLGALMGVGVIHVMTHDSIGLGEDGPTHQPVEHLASLRAIPNLTVIRPADAVETAEAWEIALASLKTPTLLALSRQSLPLVRDNVDENKTAKGAYILRDVVDRQITLIATGSEVEVALSSAKILVERGIRAAVVSAPSFELFATQDVEYRQFVLGDAPRIGIEAALRQSWEQLLRHTDGFIGMTGFGASAPAPKLYEHFGITAEAVANAAISLIQRGA